MSLGSASHEHAAEHFQQVTGLYMWPLYDDILKVSVQVKAVI